MEIYQFHSRLFDAIGRANGTLRTRFLIARRERVEKIKGLTAVVGDLHGDLYTFRAIRDRLSIDLREGRIQNVVFLGDIMDRGENSAYTLLELLEFFNEFPEQVYIIRGNHETADMYERFSDEHKPARNDPYLRDISYDAFRELFNRLPYALVINDYTLATHGGIPHVDYWGDFFGTGLLLEDEDGYEVAKSTMWADYSPSGDARSMNIDRTIGDRSVIRYSEGDLGDFFESGKGTRYEYITRNLHYLIRAHQPSLVLAFPKSFAQSPTNVVTTIFGAIENQSKRFMRAGITVALVTEDDVPPVPYFTVYSPRGGDSRECRPYFCSEERFDSDFRYDPNSELERAFYEDKNDDEYEYEPEPEPEIEPMYPRLRRPSLAFNPVDIIFSSEPKNDDEHEPKPEPETSHNFSSPRYRYQTRDGSYIYFGSASETERSPMLGTWNNYGRL